jgi:hypothetical protein
MRIPVLAALAVLLASCGSGPPRTAANPPQKAEAAKPADESRRFPLANRLDTKVIDTQLMGKPFMPGGTLADYKKRKVEYSMFVAKSATPADAAILLLDWSKALEGAHLVPSFGGYFGKDAGRSVFVFTKGAWIAGVAGLPEKEADLQARTLAAHLSAE